MTLNRTISNIVGWRTKRRIVVLESDDWGSIRMPSRQVYFRLKDWGYDWSKDDGHRFNKYDTLATSEDLTELFSTLSSVRDSSGRHIVMTPVSVVANPDFRKIVESGYSTYYYEPITDTLNRYAGCEQSFKLWHEGISNRLFVPQFHGREHLNVKAWMNALSNNNETVRQAFTNEMWGISTASDPTIGIEIQAAFDFLDREDLKYHREVLSSGLILFKRLFGYKATYFVPPNGPFSSELESACVKEGLRFLSVSKIREEPGGNGRSSKRFHWLGQKSKSGIMYLTRNCFFEPGIFDRDWVDMCLRDIEIAFKWRKPAIISTHRVNYVGGLYDKNRHSGLARLGVLLKQIVKRWPDSEFLTSAELGEIISHE